MAGSRRAEPTFSEKVPFQLVTVILGALILWVGQTTFQHNGKLTSLETRVIEIGVDYDRLKIELDNRTALRFTREDGTKLDNHIESVRHRVCELQSGFAAQAADFARQCGQIRCDKNCDAIAAMREQIASVKASLTMNERQLASVAPASNR